MNVMGAIAVQMLTTLKRLRGNEGVYKRNNGHELTFTFVSAKHLTNVNTAQGRLTIVTHDWLILAAELLDGEETFLPERRERITIDDVIYEVLPDRTLDHWEYFDSARRALRIRTLVIGEVTA